MMKKNESTDIEELNKNEIFEFINPYIKDKEVLDLGCCGWYSRHTEEDKSYESRGWLHGYIKRNAKSVVGLDISKECIEFLEEKGYNVKLANAENFNIGQKFDVVVAGDIIEHLSNFQGFLTSINNHLKESGLLILTTPNVFYFKQMLFTVLRGYPAVNQEHICWFDEITIRQLLERFGLHVISVSYRADKRECTMYRKCSDDSLQIKDLPFRIIGKLLPFKKIKYESMIIIAKKR